MADGDFYAKNLAPKWRAVARTMDGQQDAEVVASLAREAFAETMRLAHGVPGLSLFVDAFEKAARSGDRDTWLATSELVRRAARHHANTEQAALAGQLLLENHGSRLASLSAETLAQELAEATAKRIAQHHFARCHQGRLHESFAVASELHALGEAAIARMDIPALARELLQHEDGVGFKAPPRQTPAAGTAALLSRPLVVPEP